jgi:hypothetical protein
MDPLDSDLNFADIEKILVIEEVSFRLDEFHAVRIPQEALEASTVIKFCRELARKVADLKWLISDNFVSCSKTISKEF